MSRLPLSFFARDVLEVAPDLVGRHLRRGSVVLRITEVEAYRWPGDTACHARSGLTPRNAPLWGPPGRAYVYLCYGLHHMLNVVTGDTGSAQAVLVRACEPVAGLDAIRRRRGDKSGPVLLTGPGKIGQALDLDTSWSTHLLTQRGGLTVHAGSRPARLAVGPRVGIDYAEPEHRALPWRFADADSAWVTRGRELRPLCAATRGRARPRPSV
jgi:DNA-3-methyladenine glycosylase